MFHWIETYIASDTNVVIYDCRLLTVWPENIAKCLLKLPKNDFTRKIIDFDTFKKIA